MRAEAKADTGLASVVRAILKERGPAGLYDGLSAGVSRQLVYATVRLGGYDVFRDAIVRRRAAEGGVPVATFGDRLVAGALSGGFAAYLSCPVEVAMVRMQADGSGPAGERRGYAHVGDALRRIATEEGVRTYWRGSTPTVVRATAVGVTQVGFYDQCKSWLVQSGYFAPTSVSTFVTSSLITGVVYSFLTMPIETVKIRMQNQKPQADGSLRYRNMAQALGNVARVEGVSSLWRGYVPYYTRCGLHTLSCFFVLEQCKAFLTWSYAPKM